MMIFFEVLPLCDPKDSTFLTTSMPSTPGRRRRACHPATGSWQCRGRTATRWCWVQRWPWTGHQAGVLEGEVLVLELVAVDGLAPGAVARGEVTTLAHEVGDDPVEGGALEPEALLPGAEGAEVLRGLGHHVSAQLHDDLAH